MKNELEVQQPVNLIQMAIEKGSTMETLKGLMDLQERWEKNEARKKFKQAMVDFQREKPELKKNSHVKFNSTNYSFNSLPNIQRAVDPVLSEQGLSYRWEQEQMDDNSIKITCIVSHIAGHEERTYLIAKPDTSGSKNPVQQIGSTVSYLKRYTLEGALGLSSDKDDDAGKPKELPVLTELDKRWSKAVEAYRAGKSDAVKRVFTISDEIEAKLKKEAGV